MDIGFCQIFDVDKLAAAIVAFVALAVDIHCLVPNSLIADKQVDFVVVVVVVDIQIVDSSMIVIAAALDRFDWDSFEVVEDFDN